MRTFLKTIYRVFSILLMVGAMAFTMIPATDAEAAALGSDNNQFNVVQMRLAKAMMTVAPDFVVTRYAEATGLPQDMIHTLLTAKAAGEPIIPRGNSYYETQNNTPVDPNRRTGAGGALFVRPD